MKADIAVVGAGIVGMASARELQRRRPSARIVVLEREPGVAQHQTGHNSGVIHVGVYYQPGSLKAKLCVQGARAMYEFCSEHDVPVERCGKLIVASDEQQVAQLDELHRRGRANGVAGLSRLPEGELREREPNVVGRGALWSPNTGIVDFSKVTGALRDNFVAAGGELRFNADVVTFASLGEGNVTKLANGENVESRRTLVCAGAWSDRLAVASGAQHDPRIVPFRGQYLMLRPERVDIVRSLIYPVPDPALPFLGVHLTPTIDGQMLIGPTARLSTMRGYGRPTLRDLRETLIWPGTQRLIRRHWRAGVGEIGLALSRKAIVRAAATFVPSLALDDVLAPGWHGIRAQAVARDGSLVDDFEFSETKHALHVRNAPSPGATSAFAIARYVADRFEALGV